MTKCVKTDDILLSLTSALDMSLPRVNPDVCGGASVGAGGSYGDKALTSKWYISVVITLLTLRKEEEIHKKQKVIKIIQNKTNKKKQEGKIKSYKCKGKKDCMEVRKRGKKT